MISTVQELEEAVRRLSPAEQAAFCAWYAQYDAEQWDRQFEADVAAGRLERLELEARRDQETGPRTDR